MSLTDNQTDRLSVKIFRKLLYMARLQGWEPERMRTSNWPLPSWDTEIALPDVGPHRQGLVSKNDAREITGALRTALTIGGVTWPQELESAATQFIPPLGKSALIGAEESELVAGQ